MTMVDNEIGELIAIDSPLNTFNDIINNCVPSDVRMHDTTMEIDVILFIYFFCIRTK